MSTAIRYHQLMAVDDKKKPLEDEAVDTPIHVSTTQFPIWKGTAETLARELAPHPDLRDLVSSLQHYADIFERWNDPVLRPPSEDRSPIIREYFKTYRTALEELSKRGWKNPPPRPPPNDPRKPWGRR